MQAPREHIVYVACEGPPLDQWRLRENMDRRLWGLGFLTMFFLSSLLLPVGPVLPKGGMLALLITVEAHAEERSIQGHSHQAAAQETGAGQTSIGLKMRKEAVRKLWGEPAEIRKVRTCFGAAEEWVYRGDPQRYGASERVLQFDEDGVLTEIR